MSYTGDWIFENHDRFLDFQKYFEDGQGYSDVLKKIRSIRLKIRKLKEIYQKHNFKKKENRKNEQTKRTKS